MNASASELSVVPEAASSASSGLGSPTTEVNEDARNDETDDEVPRWLEYVCDEQKRQLEQLRVYYSSFMTEKCWIARMITGKARALNKDQAVDVSVSLVCDAQIMDCTTVDMIIPLKGFQKKCTLLLHVGWIPRFYQGIIKRRMEVDCDWFGCEYDTDSTDAIITTTRSRYTSVNTTDGGNNNRKNKRKRQVSAPGKASEKVFAINDLVALVANSLYVPDIQSMRNVCHLWRRAVDKMPLKRFQQFHDRDRGLNQRLYTAMLKRYAGTIEALEVDGWCPHESVLQSLTKLKHVRFSASYEGDDGSEDVRENWDDDGTPFCHSFAFCKWVKRFSAMQWTQLETFYSVLIDHVDDNYLPVAHSITTIVSTLPQLRTLEVVSDGRGLMENVFELFKHKLTHRNMRECIFHIKVFDDERPFMVDEYAAIFPNLERLHLKLYVPDPSAVEYDCDDEDTVMLLNLAPFAHLTALKIECVFFDRNIELSVTEGDDYPFYPLCFRVMSPDSDSLKTVEVSEPANCQCASMHYLELVSTHGKGLRRLSPGNVWQVTPLTEANTLARIDIQEIQ